MRMGETIGERLVSCSCFSHFRNQPLRSRDELLALSLGLQLIGSQSSSEAYGVGAGGEPLAYVLLGDSPGRYESSLREGTSECLQVFRAAERAREKLYDWHAEVERALYLRGRQRSRYTGQACLEHVPDQLRCAARTHQEGGVARICLLDVSGLRDRAGPEQYSIAAALTQLREGGARVRNRIERLKRRGEQS